MKIIDYLTQYFEEVYEPILLIDDIYYFNDVTLNEWEFIKHRINYDFFNFEELRKNKKFDIIDRISKINNYLITKEGIIDLNELNPQSHKSYYSFIDKKIKGLILLKPKTEKIKKAKKYITVNDLKSPNICLFVSQGSSGDIHVICYDNSISKKDFNYILFAITIYKDIQPYGAGIVDTIVGQKYIDGQNIIYPIGAYFTNGNKLTSHRSSVSRGARRAWYSYYTQKNRIMIPFAPIDDRKNPITISREDDSQVFKKLTPREIKQVEDLKLNGVSDKNIIKKIKSGHYLDWVYSLNKEFISDIRDVTSFLIKNHQLQYKGFKNLEEKERKISFDAFNFFAHRGLK